VLAGGALDFHGVNAAGQSDQGESAALVGLYLEDPASVLVGEYHLHVGHGFIAILHRAFDLGQRSLPPGSAGGTSKENCSRHNVHGSCFNNQPPLATYSYYSKTTGCAA